MNSKAITWGRKVLIITCLSVILGLIGYTIDHAYFEYPLGTGVVGITTKDSNQLPATSEIAFSAIGLDTIQLDISAHKNNSIDELKVEIEVIDPKGKNSLNAECKVKKYPSGFLPNPGKWQTFYIQNTGKGEYKLRITQNQHGEFNVYFYQGPFILRFLLLPLLAIFVYFLYSFTFEKKVAKTTNTENN